MSSNTSMQSLCSQAPSDFLRVIEMLLVGVAFKESNKMWRVFSIYGDELGAVSTPNINYASYWLKQRGLVSNSAKEYFSSTQPNLRFCHDKALSNTPQADIDALIDKLLKSSAKEEE